MSTYRGFVRSIQVRDDSWVEFEIQAVHAGNAIQTFFIRDLDGDVNVAHKRLGHLSLLRDALARILPVEIEYDANTEQGNVVQDITIFPRPSIEGRQGNRRIEGTVIGLTVSEFSPVSSTTPYTDKADLVGVVLLSNGGTIEHALLDLQRPDVMTAQSIFGLLREALRTRRPVAVIVTVEFRDDTKDTAKRKSSEGIPAGYIQTCAWLTVPEDMLDYLYAFIERLGQRYESYESTEAAAISYVRVTYTTAPGQTPEGDISDNSSFIPQTKEAWVHSDSPLLARLEAALRDKLQVKLGLKETQVHEVELVGHLGSASKPIWIEVKRSLAQSEDTPNLCRNIPTIQAPSSSDFDEIPVSVLWLGHAYFNEGIWRFVTSSQAEVELLIDDQTPCSGSVSGPRQIDKVTGKAVVSDISPRAIIREQFRYGKPTLYHAYLDGMHSIKLIVKSRTCSQPFQLLVYRIR